MLITGLKGRNMYRAPAAPAAGIPVSFPIGSTPQEKEEILKRVDADTPNASVRPSTVKVKEDNPFSIGVDKISPFRFELLVNEGLGFSARKPEIIEGRPNFNLKKKDIYQIKIINEGTYEVAVEISIDGVDVFAFCNGVRAWKGPGPPPKPYIFVFPKGEVTLKGWPIDAKNSQEFLVGEYIQGSTRTKDVGEANLGMISMIFRPSWIKGEPKPHELLASRGAAHDPARCEN